MKTKIIPCLLVLLFSGPLLASDWSMLAYGGKWTETDLLPILFRQRTDYRGSYLWALGMNRHIRQYDFLSVEAEGTLAGHSGAMTHGESTAAVVGRIDLPLGIRLRAGEGLSIASRNPGLENRRFDPLRWPLVLKSQKSSPVLNYLSFELDAGLPDGFQESRLLFRIHHRSGIFGLMCPPTCGSNFISYGVRLGL